MKKPVSDKKKDTRRQHNTDLIRRMRNGESLYSFDSTSSWFPPRPIISKDKQAIKQLYGDKAEPVEKLVKEEEAGTTTSSPGSASRAIKLVRRDNNRDEFPTPPIGEAS